MSSRKPGFTIVELLVVAALMSLLFGLVLAGGRPTASPRRMAQEFASMILAAQSRALGRPEGAAVILEPDSGNTRIAVTLHEGVTMPPVVVASPAGAMTASQDIKETGYRVRFQSTAAGGTAIASPWLGLRNGLPVRRDSAGQTPQNTLITPPAAGLQALVIRYPVPGPKPMPLPAKVAVDLKNSGLGESPTAPHGLGTFENKGRLAIVFDQTGRVAELVPQCGGPPVAGQDPVVPNEMIYFVFAERPVIASDGTLGDVKSVWVAINPQSGRINVSSNVAGAGLTINRENARKGMAIGK